MKKLGLLLLAVLMISVSSCGEAADKAKDATNKAVEATTDAAKDAADATKEAAKDAVDATKDAANEAVDATKDAANDAVDATKEAAKDAVDAAKDAVTKVDGKTLFMENGCVACHNADKKTVGPSIKEIAAGYADKKAEMIKFLKAEGKAIIDPAQFAVMQPNLNTTKGMSDDQLSALADYFYSIK